MSPLRAFTDFSAQLRRFIDSSLDAPQAAAQFNSLALELFRLQFAHNGPFQHLCRSRGTRPDKVEHWTQIPAVPAAAFKEWDFSCLPEQERGTIFLSSGTTGQAPSRHYHSEESLALYEASLLPWFARHLLPARGHAPANERARLYILSLTPPLAQAPSSSLVHMCEAVRRNFGSTESAFLGQVNDAGAWLIDPSALLAKLKAAGAEPGPVLLLGTAFSFIHLLDHLIEQRVRFELPTGSRVMETGGYKGRSRAVPKPQLHALLAQQLGIPRSHIVSEYGMSELSSQAYDAVIPEPGRNAPPVSRVFQFPPWARAQVISSETGTEVSSGEIGLIRVFDLANVFSVMALQTEDLAVRRAQGFELIGRAVLSEPRGCSLMAASAS